MDGVAPSPAQLRSGVLAFREHDPRDAMYRVASDLVKCYWGHPRDLANAVGVLLLTWNQAHYRYGPPDLARLEQFLQKESAALNVFRGRDLSTYCDSDTAQVDAIFNAMLAALEIASGKNRGRRSPVGVAKALHLLAPRFFPLWDKRIASAYGCSYGKEPAHKYRDFMSVSRALIACLGPTIDELRDGRSPLKVLDEYNYETFTRSRT